MPDNSLFADALPRQCGGTHPQQSDRVRALWSERWAPLARATGIRDGEPLIIALSGGSDSVLLLQLARQADPAHPLRAVHVDHGLRAEESSGDAQFCAELCHRLGVEFRLRKLDLDGRKSGLEARARALRYRALLEEAADFGDATIVTAHHADDALETLLLRWTRGTRTGGLAGLAPRRSFGMAPRVSVARPLVRLRKAQLGAWLAESQLDHRDDSSNADLDFARNRLRRQLLPQVEAVAGTEGIENLFAFANAVQGLENALEQAISHLAWTPIPHAQARGTRVLRPGGRVARGDLMRLSPALRKCALSRLLLAGTMAAPGRALLDTIARDLREGRSTRRALGGGWSLHLRAAELVLEPPGPAESVDAETAQVTGSTEPALPFPVNLAGGAQREYRLCLPGLVRMADGRRLSAQVLRPRAPREVPREECVVELDFSAVADPRALRVRFPRPGDRFHALGAPGSKSLTRFLADRGIPRSDRPNVPLVTCGSEILWVAGVRPAERPRVRANTVSRLRLELETS